LTVATEASELLREQLGMTDAEASRVAAAMPEVDGFRLWVALRYLRRAASPFDVFFFVEALVAAKQRRKCDLVTKLFRDHASPEDKIELAEGWAFSDPYRFGSGGTPIVRHAMHADCFADTRWVQDNAVTPEPQGCWAGPHTNCPCVKWLREKPGDVDRVLGIVVGHLCDMRHGLVHESWPTAMVAEYDASAAAASATYSSTVLDIYPCDPHDPDRFRSYESGVSFDRFKAIATATARNHLLAAYP
jgi:hypothetical protein